MIFTLIVMNISIKYHQTIYDGRRRKKVNNKKKRISGRPTEWSHLVRCWDLYAQFYFNFFFFMKLQSFLWPLSGRGRRQVDLVLLFQKKNRTTCWISRRICRNRAIYERVLCTYGAVYGRIIINCQRSTKLMILEHCCSISLFLSKRTRLSCQWLPLDVGAFEGFEKKKKGKKSFQVLEQMYRCQRDMRRFGGFSI